jgi:tRNA 2-thiouridine synthesizing protein A
MPTIDRTIDCRDILCPGPVIEVSKAIKGLQVNGVLEVLATDPGFVPDIQAFSKRTGHALLAAEHDEVGVRVLIRRTR